MGWFSKSDKSTDDAYRQVDSLDACMEVSNQEPVVLFKHSTTCPVSTYAKNEVDAFLNNNSVPVYLVVVQSQRPLSNEIADRLSVRHESPQALCIRNGEVTSVYNHNDITAANLSQATQ